MNWLVSQLATSTVFAPCLLQTIVATQRKLQMEIATKGRAQHCLSDGARCLPPFETPAGKVLETGEARDIPLLIGSTLDEGHAWMAQDEVMRAETDFSPVLEIARKAFREDGSGLPAGRREAASKPWELLSAILTWTVFEKTVLNYAQAHMKSGGQVWTYRFDWRPTADARYGACHCIEIPFVFDNLAFWPEAAMVAGRDAQSFQTLVTGCAGLRGSPLRATGSPQTPAYAGNGRDGAHTQRR